MRPTECQSPADPLELPKKIALVVCSDKNQIWQAVFFLLRHKEMDRDGIVDLYYYTTDPIDPVYRDLLEPHVKIVYWDKGLPDTGYQYPPYITEAGLLRLFALEELCSQYDYVAYSDTDVFLNWGRFADLCRVDLGDAPFAAVRDRLHWADLRATRYFNNTYVHHLPEAVHGRYFNSGVLIANGQQFLRSEISQKAIRFLTDFPNLSKIGDQSALNAVADGKWMELSPSWNWQVALEYPALTRAREPRLIHTVGRVKPWRDKWHQLDSRYIGAMREFIIRNDLKEITQDAFDRESTGFQREKRIVARSQESEDLPETLWKEIRHYLDREDFADVAQGVPAYAHGIGR